MKHLNAVHINSYFLSNKIHISLYRTIAMYRQDKFLIPVYKRFKEKHVDGISIDYVFSGLDKALFFTKIIKVLYLFYKRAYNKNLDYIHAHTLISDGLPTYLLASILKKRYVITVRSTDVDYFIKRSSVFKLIAKVILESANIVFFVSPAYKQRIIELYPGINNGKFMLLPNGIDAFWSQNIFERKRNGHSFETVNLLFVGSLIKRKNLDILIKFLQTYDDRTYYLTVVGPNTLNLDFAQISQTLKSGNTINYLGEVKDMQELLEVYRKHDIFVMLSSSETFGVVYIEALSQGLPILYTQGDGVDGYFEDGLVGYACHPHSLEELKTKIELVISNYNTICKNTTKAAAGFEWPYLAQQYINTINAKL